MKLKNYYDFYSHFENVSNQVIKRKGGGKYSSLKFLKIPLMAIQ